jgi:hypothetical protein
LLIAYHGVHVECVPVRAGMRGTRPGATIMLSLREDRVGRGDLHADTAAMGRYTVLRSSVCDPNRKMSIVASRRVQ